jgi:hypothetical protein
LEKYYRFWKQEKLSQIKGMWKIEIPVVGVRGYPNWEELLSELFRVHYVFYVFMLRKYVADPSHILEPQPVSLKEENMYGKSTLEENKMSRRLFGNQRTDTRAVPPVVRLTSTNFEDEIF